MRATLRALHALGGSGRVQEIYEKVLVLEEVPDSESSIRYNNGKLKLRYELDWSRTFLRHAGLLTNPAHGEWALHEADPEKYSDDQLKAICEAYLSKQAIVLNPGHENDATDIPEETETGLHQTTSEAPTGQVASDTSEARESIRMQARVAVIGATMGFSVWVPNSDKERVRVHIPESMRYRFLDQLNLAYNEVTLGTIRDIDVLWLQGNAIMRAFEIEHTTAIYSGLLRMADLLALQPNINISLHIVAPDEREGQVLKQIKRPAFSETEMKLPSKCSFISYTKMNELAARDDLEDTKPSVLSKYEVRA